MAQVTALEDQITVLEANILALKALVTILEVKVTALMAPVITPEDKVTFLEVQVTTMEVRVTAGTRVTTLEVMATQVRTHQEGKVITAKEAKVITQEVQVTPTQVRTHQEGKVITAKEAKVITQEVQVTPVTRVTILAVPTATPTFTTPTGRTTLERSSAPIQPTKVWLTCPPMSAPSTIQGKYFAYSSCYSCLNVLMDSVFSSFC